MVAAAVSPVMGVVLAAVAARATPAMVPERAVAAALARRALPFQDFLRAVAAEGGQVAPLTPALAVMAATGVAQPHLTA